MSRCVPRPKGKISVCDDKADAFSETTTKKRKEKKRKEKKRIEEK